METITNSENETKNLGKKISHQLRGGDILLISGDLGAGKTVFVKGIAKGLGVNAEITSPTFNLMNIYPAEQRSFSPLRMTKLVHIDTYRLKDEQELLDIGVEDYLGKPDIICIIEWPEKISEVLKNIRQRQTRLGREKTVTVTIQHLDKTGRKITVTTTF